MHGTLTLGATSIVGTLSDEDDYDFEVIIDGVTDKYRANSFAKDDGWAWTPDPVQLPTKKGAVIQIHGRIPFIRDYDGGGWLVSRKDGQVLDEAHVLSVIRSVGGEFKVLFEGVDE